MYFLPLHTLGTWRKAAFWLVGLGFLAGIGLGLEPGYHTIKSLRVRRLLGEGRILAGQNRWLDAQQKISAALTLDPQDPAALCAMARLLGAVGSPAAFPFWDQVATRQKISAGDQQAIITLALGLKRLDIAGRYLAQALEQAPLPVEILRCAALYYEAQPDPMRAIQFARGVLELQPGDMAMKLLLAQHLLGATTDKARSEAKDLLGEVIRSNTPEAIMALTRLSRVSDLSAEELRQGLGAAKALTNLNNQLIALSFQLRLEPQRRAEFIALATTCSAKEGGWLALARWLNQHGELQRVVEVIPEERALAERDLFLSYSDALAGLGAWSHLEAILDRDQVPLDPVLRELYRARVAGQMQKRRQAELHWAQVHWLAAADPRALAYVAEYAEKLGENEEATKAYRRLAQDPPSARGAWLGLVRLAQRRGDTAELRSMMRKLVALDPADPALRNDLAYLDLLCGENILAAFTTAQKLVERHPDLLAYRTTLALGCLRLDQPQVARAVYHDLSIDSQTAPPACQAVFAAVLGANGETEAARQVAHSIPFEPLKAEERSLIQAWR